MPDARETIGLVGLGLLGSALAERLVGAGFAVIAYDRDTARLQLAEALGVRAAASAVDVAETARRLVLCLPDSGVVEQVVKEIFDRLREGAVLIDTTTGDPERTAALGARLAARNVAYLDATVAGSSALARAGQAVVMAGSTREAFEACQDVLAAFARERFYVGPCGSGARMKLVVNLVLGLNRAVLAEGLSLASRLGLDPGASLTVLKSGAAYSRVMDAKGSKMINGDLSAEAKLSQHLKDVRLIVEAGQRAGIELPLSLVHRQLLEQVEKAGYGEADNSAVIKAYS